MTAAIGPGKSQIEAVKGLALLRLMAEAADTDKESVRWVNRRVEQLEFLDERAVRWQVSVDFEVPEAAPIIHVAGQDFRLVPLTSWEKDNLLAFDLRDEAGNTIWLPTSAETNCLLSSALIYWAAEILNRANQPEEVTLKLKDTLKALVSEGPSPEQKTEERKRKRNANQANQQDKDLFGVLAEFMIGKDRKNAAGRYLTEASWALRQNEPFWSQVNELWRNFLIIVAVQDKPGTRRVFKMAFESKVDFRWSDSRRKRIIQSMGWRQWQLELFIGGRGGSYHLEVAAPPGVDIIRIRARPRTIVEDRSKYVVSYGGSPHVHLRIPDQRLRYLATTRVRVSRPGWLTTCWLAGLAIAGVLLVGVLNLSVLFSSAPEAGTAATVLLALLAVIATMLVSPGVHPLASRLLWGARSLILIDSGVVLWAAGSLLLHTYSSHHHFATNEEWWVLFTVSALCAAGLTVSWRLPRGPRETMDKDREKGQEDGALGDSANRDPASLTIPAADGFHYGDDLEVEWDKDKQTKLVHALRDAERAASRCWWRQRAWRRTRW